MPRDRAIGVALVIGAIIGVFVYGYLVFLAPGSIPLYVIKITLFVAILAILAILGWIGYVMATTPPPVPLEPEPTTAPAGQGTPTTTQSADKP
jgi:predicted DNA-binding transcriptional regulator